MATIYSTQDGQVVRSSDAYGQYYYLADGLGTPTAGGWEREEDAIAALDGEGPAPTLEIDEQGYRLVECAYCGCTVRPGDAAPKSGDDDGWAEASVGHAEGCEWVETRAHSREV